MVPNNNDLRASGPRWIPAFIRSLLPVPYHEGTGCALVESSPLTCFWHGRAGASGRRWIAAPVRSPLPVPPGEGVGCELAFPSQLCAAIALGARGAPAGARIARRRCLRIGALVPPGCGRRVRSYPDRPGRVPPAATPDAAGARTRAMGIGLVLLLTNLSELGSCPLVPFLFAPKCT